MTDTEALGVTDLHAGFPGRSVLHGVTLAVQPSEIVAVVGLNGAGKSVLGRAISGVVEVTSGAVRLCGCDVTRDTPHQRVRRGLHHLSQDRSLVPELTVEENLRLAARVARRRYRRDALDEHPQAAALASRRCAVLSGGERALVALARAALARPAMLIADEPTAGLAEEAHTTVSDWLTRMTRHGAGILLIEQNLGFAVRMAHRVVVLRSGEVSLTVDAEDANPEVILGALA